MGQQTWWKIRMQRDTEQELGHIRTTQLSLHHSKPSNIAIQNVQRNIKRQIFRMRTNWHMSMHVFQRVSAWKFPNGNLWNSHPQAKKEQKSKPHGSPSGVCSFGKVKNHLKRSHDNQLVPQPGGPKQLCTQRVLVASFRKLQHPKTWFGNLFESDMDIDFISHCFPSEIQDPNNGATV